MPEQRSGQCDPVTGDALFAHEAAGAERHASSSDDASRSARSTVASALAITQKRNQHQSGNIRLVPVSATSHALDTSHQLPPSPPSTPSQSPPALSNLSESWEPAGYTPAKDNELRHALASMTVHEDNLPDTPDASPSTVSHPDGMVHHQLSASACDFVKSVLPNVPIGSAKGKGQTQCGRYMVEDGGMELVCQGWAGAVLIDTKPSYMPVSSSSFSPGSSRIRHGLSSRMSRSSSASSASAIERRSPRRTLLTRIGASDLTDTKDLRARILDVLDHATERLHVDNVVFVLDRTGLDEERFRAIVHGLCYVGGNIIGHGPHDDAADDRYHAQQIDNVNGDESIHAPRSVGRNLVLLSVDV